MTTTGWEDRAAGWIAWAQRDSYPQVSPSFFDLLPEPRGRCLEVGCGEGRVCRDLRAGGYRVTGLDAAPTLVAAARERDPDGEYVVGTAETLPFADRSFDLVVAYNSLMDVSDMPAAVREAARVLVPGGRFCACVTHPVRDAGRFESREPGAPFVISGSYAEAGKCEVAATRGDLTFTFAWRRYPIESYARALETAGFLIEALREPRGFDDRDRRVPEFLHWRAVKA